MVRDGFYSNRTDFIRTAIRNQLDRHNELLKNSVARQQLDLGLRRYSREDLEAVQAAKETLRIQVLGLVIIAADVSPELARDTIASIHVLGALPNWDAVLRKYQQHKLPDIGKFSGAGPQRGQGLPFNVAHELPLFAHLSFADLTGFERRTRTVTPLRSHRVVKPSVQTRNQAAPRPTRYWGFAKLRVTREATDPSRANAISLLRSSSLRK
jgi:Arc/MetJ-type ribon-helix-helix transcriptional regulator